MELNNVMGIEELRSKVNSNLEDRDNYYKMIVNSSVISKFTGREGIITDIDKKNVYVNYECWASIPTSLEKYKDVLDVEEYINENINKYVETFNIERKLNRLAKKLANQ